MLFTRDPPKIYDTQKKINEMDTKGKKCCYVCIDYLYLRRKVLLRIEAYFIIIKGTVQENIKILNLCMLNNVAL